MTVVELYFGAYCSDEPDKNRRLVNSFIHDIDVIPFNECIDVFCNQKARLRRAGTIIEDNDLYIGTTAVALDYIMVTENVKHLSRIENIKLENWVNR